MEIIWNTRVKKIRGDLKLKKIDSILIEDTINFEQSHLDLDGFFVAIGHSPTTNIFKNLVDMDNEGYILTQPDSTKTSIEAAGDVTDKVFRQAVTAAGMGCMGAMEAKEFLNKKKII